MLNNNFELLEELLSGASKADGSRRVGGQDEAARSFDNRPEDFHRAYGGNGHKAEAYGEAKALREASPRVACLDEDDPAYRQSRVDSLLWAYRDVGYLYADLNPLGESYSEKFTSLVEVQEQSYHRLSLEEFGLSAEDLDRVYFAGGGLRAAMPLKDILERFRGFYCEYVGVEFLHIQNKDMREWLISRMEDPAYAESLDPSRRLTVLEDLVKAEELERFLQRTFIGQKRFSLEGSEAVIPALHYILDGSSPRGIERIAMGSAHRGRLTILALIVGKPLEELFYLFEEGFMPGVFGGSDDVKYHIGYSSTYDNEDGTSVAISLSPNASHLESVGPIVEGRARGVQDLLAHSGREGDDSRKRVLPVVIHGDAALAGQGVVAETFNMSQLDGYSTGGSIHLVINNQIGFTTPSRSAHSNLNPTDIAKMNPVPVFHVNGDRPEAVIRVMRTALDFRQEFGSDVVVDIFCYRRHGHNEGDEPSFTHPYMYDLIESHPSAAALYGEECVASGLLSAGDLEAMRKEYVATLEAALQRERGASASAETAAADASAAVRAHARENALAGSGSRAEGPRGERPRGEGPRADTRVEAATLARIVEGVSAFPRNLRIHDKLKSIVSGKLRAFKEKGVIDWSLAEAAAFGSLLLEGIPVRLSGEDSERGTFSQRHIVWWDVDKRGNFYIPLDNLASGQTKMAVYDSPLSEFGVLGFEYGYAAEYKDALVMWEAQFGDFSNGGQVVIDNYVIAAEAKWGAAVGLVLLLPHGYEGQGPEHSSAHLERFLLLCAEGNIRVAYPTTPAQYFHLLRAQAKDPVKKPLIVMTPKSLLRHPAVLSPIADFSSSGFQPVLDDPVAATAATRLLFCSGKIYYDLAQRRKEIEREDIAIIRIERLYPFPESELRSLLAKYPSARSLGWVQEEPKNRGAWNFTRDNFETSFPNLTLAYIGRKASASPATGSHERHGEEQEEILGAAVGPRGSSKK